MTNTPNTPNTPDELINFLNYLYVVGSETTTLEELDELYEKNVCIEFNGHKVEIPFDAVIYNELINLISNIIKEW